MPDGTPHRVVTLPGRDPAPAAAVDHRARPRGRRLWRRPFAVSYGLLVLLPAFLAALYFGLFASDRYVSGAGFAVRGMNSGGSMDLLGSFTGLTSTGSTTSDSFILLNYLEGRDLVGRLEAEMDLRAAFAGPGIDPLSRLRRESPIEEVVDYWSTRIDTNFDNTSGIITFEVQAFTPQSARAIAAAVLQACRDLVNDLSRQARQDAVANAVEEVARAERRLAGARDKLTQFRQTEKSVDPTLIAKLQLELIGGLDGQLAGVRARMAALEGAVDASSPTLTALRRQADALEQQIAERRDGIGQPADGEARLDSSLARQLAAYEALEIERSFAQQAYASALASLETARAEADRQQRYLAVYSAPTAPEEARYPDRVLTPVLILVVLSLVWSVGSLIVLAVRDHLP